MAARSSGRTLGQRAAEPAERRPHRGVQEGAVIGFLLGLGRHLVEHAAGRSGTRCWRRGRRSRSAVCSRSSLISSTLSPLVRAARTCIASSSWCPRATSAVSVISERLRRSRPGRVQMLPQAYCVISSWKSRVKSVVAGDRPVDVRVAEHLAAHGHAGVVHLATVRSSRDRRLRRRGSRRARAGGSAGRRPRAPRPGARWATPSSTTSRPSLRRRRRSRAASRAGWPRPARRPPPAPARRSRRAGRGRRTPASAPQTCDVALVVGVLRARAAAPSARSGSRSRKPGAEPALGGRRPPSTGVPDARTWPIRSAHDRGVADLRAGAQQHRGGDPVRARRAAAAGRPRRRPSRRRRRTSRRLAALGEHVVDDVQHARGQLGHRERLVGHRAVVAVARAGPRRPRRRRRSGRAAQPRPQRRWPRCRATGRAPAAAARRGRGRRSAGRR